MAYRLILGVHRPPEAAGMVTNHCAQIFKLATIIHFQEHVLAIVWIGVDRQEKSLVDRCGSENIFFMDRQTS